MSDPELEIPDDWRLHHAALKGDATALTELIAAGRDLNAFDELGYTPLHHSAMNGHLEVVKLLMAAKANPDLFDALSLTPLHYAVREEHLDVVRLLLQAGANVNANEEARIGNSPLADVAATCTLAMAQLLIEAGADPTLPGWMQLTALNRAKDRKRGEGPRVYELLSRAARRFQKRSP
jgi:hypothetical protein